jgi:hypothetical protein
VMEKSSLTADSGESSVEDKRPLTPPVSVPNQLQTISPGGKVVKKRSSLIRNAETSRVCLSSFDL